jgi:hypothetical protein
MWFQRKRTVRFRPRPAIETLEGRAVLSTFLVKNVDQLVADIAAVNNTTGPNTIVLAGGDYNLNAPLHIENAGRLTISGRANTPSSVRFFGAPPGRAMEIDGGSVTLSGVTVSGGSADQGGGILAVNTDLTVKNSTITGNTASQAGGGIFALGGTLNVMSSVVDGNSAGGGSFGQGGGIAASDATVIISASTVSNNSVSALVQNSGTADVPTVDGAGIYALGGTLAISGSKLESNTASAFTSGNSATCLGAGIGTSGTTVTITHTSFIKNSLSSFARNGALADGSALSALGGSVTITGGLFSSNNPTSWAQFHHDGTAIVIRHSIIDGRQLLGTYTISDNTLTRTS